MSWSCDQPMLLYPRLHFMPRGIKTLSNVSDTIVALCIENVQFELNAC